VDGIFPLVPVGLFGGADALGVGDEQASGAGDDVLLVFLFVFG